jgi:hypothetical protein
MKSYAKDKNNVIPFDPTKKALFSKSSSRSSRCKYREGRYEQTKVTCKRSDTESPLKVWWLSMQRNSTHE